MDVSYRTFLATVGVSSLDLAPKRDFEDRTRGVIEFDESTYSGLHACVLRCQMDMCSVHELHYWHSLRGSAEAASPTSHMPTSFFTPAKVLDQLSPYPNSITPLPISKAPSRMG